MESTGRTLVRLGPSPAAAACRVAVDWRECTGAREAVLTLAPVLAWNEEGDAPSRPIRCPGFGLRLRGGRARFGRSFSLPPELRGRGLGTFLMAWLVRRAVGLGFGALPVHGLHLVRQQDTPLRNAFYRSMGFELTLYRDGSGWARAQRLDGLRMRPNPAKVREAQAEAAEAWP